MTRSLLAKVTLLFCLGLAFVQLTYAEETDLRDLRGKWVGEYPSRKQQNLLKEPRIKTKLKLLLGAERYNRLLSDKDYLQSPIDYVEGHFILDYAANLHLMPKSERIYIIIREYTGSLHVAIQDDHYKVQWRHSDETDIPLKILGMLDLK